jgi:hypothetical protein
MIADERGGRLSPISFRSSFLRPLFRLQVAPMVRAPCCPASAEEIDQYLLHQSASAGIERLERGKRSSICAVSKSTCVRPTERHFLAPIVKSLDVGTAISVSGIRDVPKQGQWPWLHVCADDGATDPESAHSDRS